MSGSNSQSRNQANNMLRSLDLSPASSTDSNSSSSATTSPNLSPRYSSQLKDECDDGELQFQGSSAPLESIGENIMRQAAPNRMRSRNHDQSQSFSSLLQRRSDQLNVQQLAPVSRTLSFGDGLPLTGFLQNTASNNAAEPVLWRLDKQSRNLLFQELKKLEAEELERKAAVVSAQEEADARASAEKKAEQTEARAKMLQDFQKKLVMWLNQLLILIGLLAVLYCVADVMWPGISTPEIQQHWTQLLSHFGSMELATRPQREAAQRIVVASNKTL